MDEYLNASKQEAEMTQQFARHKWFMLIPGVGHFFIGKKMFGCATFLSFLFFPLIILFHIQQFIYSVTSFSLTLLLVIVSLGHSLHTIRTEIVEWWIATAILLIIPLIIWRRTAKSYQELRHPVADHSDNQIQIAWNALIKHKNGVLSIWFIASLYVIAFVSPYLAPFNPNTQDDAAVTKYRPPLSRVTVLQLRDTRFPQPTISPNDASGMVDVLEKKLFLLNLKLSDPGTSHLIFVDRYRIAGNQVIYSQAKKEFSLNKLQLVGDDPEDWESSRFYILGTDRFGRDLLSRLIFGSRVSLGLGLIAVLLAVSLGTFVGLFSGYFEGKIDSMLMRFVDMLLAFPTIFLILIIITLFEKIPIPRIMLVVLVLGATSWMGISRFVRGQVLSIKHEDYILAAKALGFSARRIIIRHVLPNVLTPIIISATLRLGAIILIEAALSFLNLGVQAPTPSWGNIIYEGKDFLSNAWWISTFPGIAIVLTVVSFNLFGDGLRDALDPRMRD